MKENTLIVSVGGLRAYGAIMERLTVTENETEKEKLQEKIDIFENLFEFIGDRETRYLYKCYCMGYSYSAIQRIAERQNIFLSYDGVKSRIQRTTKRLQKKGVIT